MSNGRDKVTTDEEQVLKEGWTRGVCSQCVHLFWASGENIEKKKPTALFPSIP